MRLDCGVDCVWIVVCSGSNKAFMNVVVVSVVVVCVQLGQIFDVDIAQKVSLYQHNWVCN